MTDNITAWNALGTWEPSYLKAKVGEQKVAVREILGPPQNVYQNMAAGGRVAFVDYLDWVLEIANDQEVQEISASCNDISSICYAIREINFDNSYYLDVTLAELSSKLLADIEIPGWFSKAPVDIIFWCGVLGTSSGLHSDIKPNCNAQIIGRKKFILFSPSQARFLYPISRMTHCRFDPNLPDFKQFPLARHAIGWECTLYEGESLYIPVGWYHQVTVMSPWAVNVNFFWPRLFPQGLVTPVLWSLLVRRGWAALHIAALRGRSR